MTRAYYNDTEEYVCNWLANLMLAGLIPDGDIDQRSIRDVTPGDLRGYTQCHFFAGLGGWGYALRLAGWPDDREVWTGSCPCQPFSAAGRERGTEDDRHLWPAWYALIRQCRPAVVLGEQVKRANVHGWLDLVANDFEREGYAFGAAVLPALARSAPHVRERTFFVAHPDSKGLEGLHTPRGRVAMQRFEANVSGDKWEANPDVLRAANGLSPKLDRPPAYKETIRALGNAIVPQVAAEFITAYMEHKGISE